MPFKEIKQPKDFIRIKSYGEVTISISLSDKYFKGKKVRIFYDEEEKKIGLQPDNEGYKIYGMENRSRRFACHPLSKIITGEFYPKWSKKLKMLVFSYG